VEDQHLKRDDRDRHNPCGEEVENLADSAQIGEGLRDAYGLREDLSDRLVHPSLPSSSAQSSRTFASYCRVISTWMISSGLTG
jgi:hypothetical protein